MIYQTMIDNFSLSFQTMGGDFTGKGQQDCSKGIYAFAGLKVFCTFNSVIYLFHSCVSHEELTHSNA